ncbi:hypothetical protein AVEN_141243-1 [Araneus ventricosus]|uniref:Uncharacterized protein n=1 Tax=Araneus ventricosus TaxID=182803 RepID=A0A4Y2ST89_ARAVE|nr:hypothetical protein AVEN_141243-1 [Araneus ventricosus]
MESKLSIAALCFLGLLVTVQEWSLGPENLAKYEKCWNYANCLSSGEAPQTINECIKILRPEENINFVLYRAWAFKSSFVYLGADSNTDIETGDRGCDHQQIKLSDQQTLGKIDEVIADVSTTKQLGRFS